MAGLGLRLALSLTGTATAPANLGPELLTNGDGSSATGWTVNSGTLAATGTALRVTAAGGFGQVVQHLTTLTAGHTYRLSGTMAPSTGDYGNIGDAASVNLYYSVNGSPSHVDFVAGSTDINIYLQTEDGAATWEPNGQFVDFTASLREVL